MTAAEFAALVQGTRAGTGRWMGICPAHPDKTRSLSIRQAKDRVLINDFAGCATTAILKALGLQLRDLFSGTPPTPEQRAAAEKARTSAEREEAWQQEAERNAFDTELACWKLMTLLSEALMLLPEGDPRAEEMTALYHQALELFRKAEAVSVRLIEGRKKQQVEAAILDPRQQKGTSPHGHFNL